MMDLLAELIECVARVWHADSKIREDSLFGESELDRRSRRVVGFLCGGVILLLVAGGFIWWWFTREL
jgi:hypothetical protein